MPGFRVILWRVQRQLRVQLIPPKRPLRVLPIPPKWPLRVPSKTAPKGSAGPLKNASLKDDSSSSRSSPTAVRVLVDIKGFVHPRHSAPSSGTQAPPKPADWDRLKKVERNLVLSNQYSVLSDDEMTRRQSRLTEVMEHSFSNETWESSKPTSRSLLCFWDGIGRLYLDCRKRF